MRRTLPAAVLCLALGAVWAETQAQSPLVSLRVANGPAVLGEALDFRVIGPASPVGPAQVWLFLGTDPGSTPWSTGGTQLLLPVGGAVVPVASFQTSASAAAGTFVIPKDPSLLGLHPLACAVWMPPSGAACFSALVPFGPIIEDSIN